ncbi:MAG: FKBP-type peptidyl-prolyl cis-trans isomerase [Gammaproteobacteria bacterium]|nr:MAG: FKBP-type peptidyl-prolyl cis-trans isomerase [Gammaproteobacteria bacterium]
MLNFLKPALFSIVVILSACSSELDIPYKGIELNSLEQTANYFQARNISKKILAMKIRLDEKPFLLGAYDVRDGIPARIPEERYTELLNSAQKNASPLVTDAQPSDVETALEGLRTPQEQISYLTARAIAKSFGKDGIPVMPTSMAIGLADAQATSTPPKISAKEEKQLVAAIQEKIKVKDNDWAENRNQFHRAEEKAFFAENIVKPDVVTLNSGIQYKIVKKGTGKLPKIKDTVTVKYRGTLLDGTEFDSSYKRGEPDSFKLSDMIPGFSQAMIQVPDGSKVIIYIPSLLAYGEKGTEGIPPYAAVIFEVELNGIKSSFF